MTLPATLVFACLWLGGCAVGGFGAGVGYVFACAAVEWIRKR